MARVAESVALEFGDQLTVAKVVTRTMEGAKRYQKLAKCLGRKPPVPSILVNGNLVFDIIPGVEELRSILSAMVNARNENGN